MAKTLADMTAEERAARRAETDTRPNERGKSMSDVVFNPRKCNNK